MFFIGFWIVSKSCKWLSNSYEQFYFSQKEINQKNNNNKKQPHPLKKQQPKNTRKKQNNKNNKKLNGSFIYTKEKY